MNLKTLVATCVELLGRPDKESEIALLTRSVIKELHNMALFSRDIVEEVIEFPAPACLLKFPLPPLYRRFKYISPVTKAGARVRTSHKDGGFKLVTAGYAITQSGRKLPDTYYIAGSAVVVDSTLKVHKLYIQYFAYPDFQDPHMESWIMSEAEDLIITGVRARFYSDNGSEQRGRELMTSYTRNMQQLVDENSGGAL